MKVETLRKKKIYLQKQKTEGKKDLSPVKSDQPHASGKLRFVKEFHRVAGCYVTRPHAAQH